MPNSAVLLDLTLSDLEGQNPYRLHFSTQPSQIESSNGKYSWMSFIFGKGVLYVIIHAGVDFQCNVPFRSTLRKKYVKKSILCINTQNPRTMLAIFRKCYL